MLSVFFQILICMYPEHFSGDSFPNNVERSNKEVDNITCITSLWGMERRRGRLQGVKLQSLPFIVGELLKFTLPTAEHAWSS